MENFDFGKCVKTASENGSERTNILVAGKTGVGKSTLIDAVFHGNSTDAGTGKSRKQEIKEITKEGVPVSIFDTKGLEIKDYKKNFSELENFIRERIKEQDPSKKIHVAWLCIQESTPRIEDAEIDLADMFYKYRIPIIAVLTKATADNGLDKQIKELLANVKNVVRVRAIETSLDGGIKIPPMNLEKLVDLTCKVLPEGIKNDLTELPKTSSAHQKSSSPQKSAAYPAIAAAANGEISSSDDTVKHQSSKAQKVVASSAAVAAAVGALPFPFADSACLIPIQIAMFARISTSFGLNLSESFLGTLAYSAIGSSAATIGGKAIVSGLLKCFPGIGTLAGAAISGATAATLTTAIGEAYIGTLSVLLNKNNGVAPTTKDIKKEFKAKLKMKK